MRTGMQAVTDTPKNVQILVVVSLVILLTCAATLIVVSAKAGKR
jgi:hypothetical protein